MKKIVLILIIILSFLFPFNDSSVKKNEQVSEADNKSLNFKNKSQKESNMNNYLFDISEYEYNHNLAIESLNLANASFSANISGANWGEDASVGRDRDIISALDSLGFSDISTYGYDVSLNDSSSKVAFAIANKKYDSNTRIVAVAIRGGGYGLEWVDNFNLGDDKSAYHKGFYTSASRLKSKLDTYILSYVSSYNIKLWITGYSRGGAVANILASMYDRAKDTYPYEIYAYTFASPKCVVSDVYNSQSDTYANIYNIISPNDPIYNVPPDKWGFSRFGITVLLPDYNNPSTQKLSSQVSSGYTSLTGERLNISTKSLSSYIDIIIKTSESRSFFYDNFEEPIKDLIKINMMRYKDKNNIWVNYTRDAALEYLHGKSALNILVNIENIKILKYLNTLGVNIPEDFYTFASLCYINGFDGYADIVFSGLTASDLSDLNYLASDKNITNSHKPEFYESWMTNITKNALQFIKE